MPPDGVSFDGTSSSEQLEHFLVSLIAMIGAPIVLTLLQADWLFDDISRQTLDLLTSLFNGSGKVKVSVHFIATAGPQVTQPEFMSASQIISNETERNGKLIGHTPRVMTR